MNKKTGTAIAAIVYAVVLSAGLMACKQKGPVERAGEEVDEAIDTAKNGGKESTANKVDDAADDLRAGAKDAAKDLRNK